MAGSRDCLRNIAASVRLFTWQRVDDRQTLVETLDLVFALGRVEVGI